MNSQLYGAVESGGTKMVCAVGTGPDRLLERTRIDTTTPEETLGKIVEYFCDQTAQHGALRAVGIGSFGPLDPEPDSPTFGHITATPKRGWSNTNFVRPLRDALGVPVAFDTDVNAAALGEHRWGAGRGLTTFIYLTIGTGIGGGGLMSGRLMHGLVHPEMGHVRIPHDRGRDPFPGACPFHGDCLEGLAAGPAIAKRWGRPAEELPADHEAWPLEAEYLALALANFVCTLSPQRIILGGGVTQNGWLLPMVRRRLVELLNNYVQADAITQRIDEYVTSPGLGPNAGVLGSIALAQRVAEYE